MGLVPVSLRAAIAALTAVPVALASGSGASSSSVSASDTVVRLRVVGSGVLTAHPAGVDPQSGQQAIADCRAAATSASPGRCAVGYPAGRRVEIRAAAAPGFRLVGWSRYECAGSVCVIRADEVEKRVTATFTGRRIAVDVRADATDAGTVTSTPAGISCPPTCVADFARDQDVLLSAAVARGRFRGWSFCSLRPMTRPEDCWLDAGSDRATTAWFMQPPPISGHPAPFERVPLEIDLGGSGAGSVRQRAATGEAADCPDDCLARFQRPSSVNLTALAAPRSRFAGWRSRFCERDDTRCTVFTNEVDAVGACFNRLAAPRDVLRLQVAERLLRVRLRRNPRLFGARATAVAGRRRTALRTSQFRPGTGVLTLHLPRGLRAGSYRLAVTVRDGVGCEWSLAAARFQLGRR